MAKSTQGPSDRARIVALEQAIYDLQRGVGGRSLAMRDLSDTSLVPVKDGQVPTYNAGTGRFEPGMPPAGLFYRTTPQTIPNGVDTAVTGDMFELQGGVTWDGAGKLTLPKRGWYVMTAKVRWVTNTTGARRLRITGAMGIVVAGVDELAGVGMLGPEQVVTTMNKFYDGQSYGMSVFQESGGPLDLGQAITAPSFAVCWLGPSVA